VNSAAAFCPLIWNSPAMAGPPDAREPYRFAPIVSERS